MRHVCPTLSALCVVVLIVAGFGCSEKNNPAEPVQIDLTNGGASLSAEKGEALGYPMEVEATGQVSTIEWSIEAVGRRPAGKFLMDADGVFHFTPAVIDEGMQFVFHVTAREASGAVAECGITVNVADMAIGFPGDINDDGELNIDDLILYEAHIQLVAGHQFDTPDELGAADANRDGYSPTIADELFMYRSVFAANTANLDLIHPFVDTAVVTLEGDDVILDVDREVAAIWVQYDGGQHFFDLIEGLESISQSTYGRAAVYTSGLSSMLMGITYPPGRYKLYGASGGANIESFEVVDIDGSMMFVDIE